MSEIPIRPDAVGGVRPGGPVDKTQGRATSGDSAAFRALLENLEQRAAGLRGNAAESPGDLAGAVDEARASLEDALDLKERLLEAYRADLSRRQGGAGE
ncbi:MAG: hypothetical protein AAFZ65_07030 [Planctomycetota bacterium]